MSGARQLCLHPRDVPDVHAAAVTAAVAVFTAARQPPGPGELDEDRATLLQVPTQNTYYVEQTHLANSHVSIQSSFYNKVCL